MDTNEIAHSTNSRKMIFDFMKLVGIALLWVGLTALAYVPNSTGGNASVIVTGLGFVSFASGLLMFAGSMKDEIIQQIRAEKRAA